MLAQKAGISPATIVNIEQQKHLPTPSTLHTLAEALGITVEQLVEEQPAVPAA